MFSLIFSSFSHLERSRETAARLEFLQENVQIDKERELQRQAIPLALADLKKMHFYPKTFLFC